MARMDTVHIPHMEDMSREAASFCCLTKLHGKHAEKSAFCVGLAGALPRVASKLAPIRGTFVTLLDSYAQRRVPSLSPSDGACCPSTRHGVVHCATLMPRACRTHPQVSEAQRKELAAAARAEKVAFLMFFLFLKAARAEKGPAAQSALPTAPSPGISGWVPERDI